MGGEIRQYLPSEWSNLQHPRETLERSYCEVETFSFFALVSSLPKMETFFQK